MVDDTIVHTGQNSVSRLIEQDGTGFLETKFYDKDSLDINQRIRDANMVNSGTLDIHDDADVRMMVSCPSTEQWILFKRKNPQTYELLMSQNEEERMKGSRQLQLLHPEWVIYSRF